MSGDCFVDTNILVYVRDASEPEKQKKAHHWLAALWESGRGRLSFQVLSEYYVTVTSKLDPGMKAEDARADIRNLMVWKPVEIDRNVMEGAWIVQDRYTFSWWDSLIVAAAQQAGCSCLLTEDMQHEQEVGGITIINPFIFSPEAII